MIGEDEANIDQWRQFWLKTAESQKKQKKKKRSKNKHKKQKITRTEKIHIIYLHINKRTYMGKILPPKTTTGGATMWMQNIMKLFVLEPKTHGG